MSAISFLLFILVLLSSLLGFRFTSALKLLDGAQSSLGAERLEARELACDSASFDGGCGLGDGEDMARDLVAGGGGLELLSGRVIDFSAFRLALTAWEQDHLGLVRVQSFHIQLELLLARVRSSVIDGDSDGASEGGREASTVDFIESETTSISDLASVLSGSRRDNWAELLDRTREGVCGLCDSTLVSSKLLSGLIEVSLNSAEIMLAQVHVRQGVVVLDHC